MLFIAPLVNGAEFPKEIKSHYKGKQNIYWKVRQISISPLFDQPETTTIEFFIQKPAKMYIAMPQKMIYSNNDTIWIYQPENKQVQKQFGDHIFNPFDIVDSSQAFYNVASAEKGLIHLTRVDSTFEPESLEIAYLNKGGLKTITYTDANGKNVILEFVKESFGKKIPKNIFINNLPKDVQIIDLDQP